MRDFISVSLMAKIILILASTTQATSVHPDEMAEARRWIAAKLEGVGPQRPKGPGVTVVANHHPVQKNARHGKPMNIAGTTYTRGLYCHASSKLVVRLPGPGKTLTAVVGVDSNEQTKPGNGTVIFSVTVSDKVLFKSPIMREGMEGIPVKIDLGEAQQCVLEISNAGDGISCDQADWANAKVVLADGKSIWLGDLPLHEQHKAPYTVVPPFSFNYGGKPSSELLKTWKLDRRRRQLDENRSEHTLTYTDPKTGLVVRCAAIEYHDFPTVEWTLYFKNSGGQDTPILAGIQALDECLERNRDANFILHHHTGSPCTPEDYRPWKTPLKPGIKQRFAPPGGRPTDSVLPYFNLEDGSEGRIIVVGWSGQWAAEFLRDESTGLHLRAGQELTHFTLHPGEEVRTPMIVLQFWKGDRVRSQNIWRRWMLAHNLPRSGGKLPPPIFPMASAWACTDMMKHSIEDFKQIIDRYLAEGLKPDYWWLDAGWYPCRNLWTNTGTWEVDRMRYPHGLRPAADHAHAKDIGFILWFEPERVAPGTWLYEKRPQWLLGSGNGNRLLNLGNPDVRTWLIERVDKIITEQGVDLYRQDFNMDPLGCWRGNDTKGRQGITEIRYVEGYLAFWDELRRRHPKMLIDSCASGGRRNDLETLRRAVPLLRSDWVLNPVSDQGQTYGIASWIPFHGTTIREADQYTIRSALCPAPTACWDIRRNDLDHAMLRRVMGQWRKFAPYYFGDYYPLTPYSLQDDAWIAWQFDCPESGEGMVQAFRRAKSPYEAARFALQGLIPDAQYILTDLDTEKSQTISGRELLEKGVRIDFETRPDSAVITYRRVKKHD
ncbi:MAG: alpha-galactosidase [Pirellulales bacterium]|nr:alpha-galactosidase [Pirellulales bacterium]